MATRSSSSASAGGSGRRGQEVRAALGGALDPLLVTPLRDRLVVAAEQHVGHGAPVPLGGLGVDGVLEQAVLVGLLDEGLGVADDTGQQASDRLDHREDRDLSAVEDVVAEREDPHGHPLAGPLVDPLVDAFVATAGEREPRLVGELAGDLLRERLAAGAGNDEGGNARLVDCRSSAVHPAAHDVLQRLGSTGRAS